MKGRGPTNFQRGNDNAFNHTLQRLRAPPSQTSTLMAFPDSITSEGEPLAARVHYALSTAIMHTGQLHLLHR